MTQYRREVRDEGKFQDSSYAASAYPVSSDESRRVEEALGGMSPKNKQKIKKERNHRISVYLNMTGDF